MARVHDIDAWGLGAKVAELWGLGQRGRMIANAIMPEVEAACRRLRQNPPNLQALTVKISRYMETDPADRRTRQARAQGAAVAIADQAAAEIVRGQIDAFQTIQAYADRLNAEVEKLESLKERDPETGALVVPDFGVYFSSLEKLSREMRGWMQLFVDIKDRLEQHQQYEKAYATILGAVRECCPPEILAEIAKRLKSDPAVVAILRGAAGGGW